MEEPKAPLADQGPCTSNSSAFFVPRPQVSTSAIEATPPNSLPRTTGKFTVLYSSVRSLLYLRLITLELQLLTCYHISFVLRKRGSLQISDAEVFI